MSATWCLQANAALSASEAAGRDVPAVIITGDTGPERLRELSGTGQQLLHKPVQPARLRAVLRHVLPR